MHINLLINKELTLHTPINILVNEPNPSLVKMHIEYLLSKEMMDKPYNNVQIKRENDTITRKLHDEMRITPNLMQIKVFLYNFNTKKLMWGIKFLCLVEEKLHKSSMPCIEY